MPFWVHGRDSESGEETDPFFSVAATEADARAQAEAQGILVEDVQESEDTSLDSLPPVVLPVSFVGSTRHLSQAIFVAVVLFVLALLLGADQGFTSGTIVACAVALVVSFLAIWYARRLAVSVTVTEATIEIVDHVKRDEHYWDEVEQIEFRTQNRYQQFGSAALAAGTGIRSKSQGPVVHDCATIIGRSGSTVFPGHGVSDYQKLCEVLQQECQRRKIPVKNLLVSSGYETEIDPWA